MAWSQVLTSKSNWTCVSEIQIFIITFYYYYYSVANEQEFYIVSIYCIGLRFISCVNLKLYHQLCSDESGAVIAVTSSAGTSDSLTVNNCHHLAKSRMTLTLTSSLFQILLCFKDVNSNLSKINTEHICVTALYQI